MVSKPGCPSVFGCPSEICIFEISLGDFDGQSKKVRHLGATALEPVLLYLFEVPAPPVVPCVTSLSSTATSPQKGKTSKLHLPLEKQKNKTHPCQPLSLPSILFLKDQLR